MSNLDHEIDIAPYKYKLLVLKNEIKKKSIKKRIQNPPESILANHPNS
jgi:hypothetical protein